MEGSERAAYLIPRYRAAGDTAFYHFLHGTVPGHQIDFMYCPEVPQGALRQTHFGHLARLIKYIEPRQSAAYGFALGNLSRDDVQHEPGHGGIAILFALRVPGVTDHAGRDMPPYAHGIVAVDRSLEYVQLLEAMTVLYRRFLEREGAEDRRGDFYRSYVRTVQERPEEVESFLANAIAEIDDIPHPPRSRLGFDFECDPASPPPAGISIVHDDDEGFGTLAHYAATLGSTLYRSNIKWTSITSGREIDIVGGTTIRFVPRSEAPASPRGLVFTLDELPDDEEELLKLLFGARRRVEQVEAPRQGWREKLAAQRSSGAARSEHPPGPGGAPLDSPDGGDVDVEIDDAAATLVAGLEQEAGAGAAQAPQGAAAFESPRSSPVTGVSAASSGAAAGFDPRRSSPVTGLSGASTPPVVASVAAAPGAVAIGSPASLPSPLPASSGAPYSVPTHLERSAQGTPRGRWIIAAAAFAAVMVIVIVSVVAGMRMQEPGPDGASGETPTGTASGPAPSADLPGSSATVTGSVQSPPPATASPSSAPATASSAPPPASATTSSSTPKAGTGTGKKGTLMGKPKF